VDVEYRSADLSSITWPDYRGMDLDLSLVALNVDGSPSLWRPDMFKPVKKRKLLEPCQCSFSPTAYLRRQDGTLITGTRSLDNRDDRYQANLFVDYQLDLGRYYTASELAVAHRARTEYYGPAEPLAYIITDGMPSDAPVPQSVCHQPSWPTSDRKKRRR
jgi:hypothetical protein